MPRKIKATILIVPYLLWLHSGAIRAAVPNAEVSLVKPAEGAVFHTGGMPAAGIPFETTNHFVEITNANPDQMLNVSWTMICEMNGNTVPGGDAQVNQIVRCNSMGKWKRLANGTGVVGGSYNAGPGQHMGTGYSDLIINTTCQSDTATDDHSFSVVKP